MRKFIFKNILKRMGHGNILKSGNIQDGLLSLVGIFSGLGLLYLISKNGGGGNSSGLGYHPKMLYGHT